VFTVRWFIVLAQDEHNGNISLDLLFYGSTERYNFLGDRTLHFIIHSLSSQGDIPHPRKLSMTYRELAVLTNVEGQTDNFHTTDFFPWLTVVCFLASVLPPNKVSRKITG